MIPGVGTMLGRDSRAASRSRGPSGAETCRSRDSSMCSIASSTTSCQSTATNHPSSSSAAAGATTGRVSGILLRRSLPVAISTKIRRSRSSRYSAPSSSCESCTVCGGEGSASVSGLDGIAGSLNAMSRRCSRSGLPPSSSGATPDAKRSLGEDSSTTPEACSSSRKSRAAHIARLGDAKVRESGGDSALYGGSRKSRGPGELSGSQGIASPLAQVPTSLNTTQLETQNLFATPDRALHGEPAIELPALGGGLSTFRNLPASRDSSGGAACSKGSLNLGRHSATLQDTTRLSGSSNLGRNSTGTSGAPAPSRLLPSPPHRRSPPHATTLLTAALRGLSAENSRTSSGRSNRSTSLVAPPRKKSRDPELEKSICMVRRTSRMVNKASVAEGSVGRGPLSAKRRFRQAANAASLAASAASPRNAFGNRFSGRASQRETDVIATPATADDGSEAVAAPERSSAGLGFEDSVPRVFRGFVKGVQSFVGAEASSGAGVGGCDDAGPEDSTTSQLARKLDEERPEISSEMMAQHLRPCALSLLLIMLLFGPYDAFCFDLEPGELGAAKSLSTLLLLRYAVCVPLCAAAAAIVHVQLRRDLRKHQMQVLGFGLIVLDLVCGMLLLLLAPQDPPRPMWATTVLVVHLWWMYTVLVLEPVPQAALCFLSSAVGGFIVWWSQLRSDDVDEREWRIINLVCWGLLFNALGLRHAFTRRAALIKHVHHRQRSMVCAEHILEEVEACERLLENIFPPQVLDDLRDNLRLGASERAAVVAQEFEGCCFLFAKVVGLRGLVDSPHRDPHRVLALLQSIFDRFDTLAETYSVQRVRKTVNESYMVAAGLPDPSLLQTPAERALGIAGLGFAMLHVMDVVNAQLAVTLGTDEGTEMPLLDVQVGIHCGSAIAGVIGHRRIQYDLVGDAVNTTARMCSYGAPGRVHVSDAMHAFVAGHYHATPRAPMEIKGKGIMTTFFLDRRKPSAEATPPPLLLALPAPKPAPPPPPAATEPPAAPAPASPPLVGQSDPTEPPLQAGEDSASSLPAIARPPRVDTGGSPDSSAPISPRPPMTSPIKSPLARSSFSAAI